MAKEIIKPKCKKHYWLCLAPTFCQSHAHKCNLCGMTRKAGDITHANIDGK